MKALRIHGYGGPEVMRLDEVPMPQAAAGEVLVRLRAASVNPIDWKMRQGLMKLPLPRTLGRDGAGVEQAGGRRILGVGSFGREGTHAQYTVFEEAACAEIPEALSFEEAAALGIAGLSAWIPLVEEAQVSAGQRVLIHAGAGGVGAFAIQIAQRRGAEVWTTCSAANAAFCRELGASRTVDYTVEDFTSAGPIFDTVLDTVGAAVHRRSADVLKKDGLLVYLQAAPAEPVARSDVRIKRADIRASRERLAALMNAGLRVPITQRFTLERASDAYERSRGGHVRGKIVLDTTA